MTKHRYMFDLRFFMAMRLIERLLATHYIQTKYGLANLIEDGMLTTSKHNRNLWTL